MTYQNNTTAPYVDLATRVERIADNQLRGGVAGATTARLHEIALPCAVGLDLVEADLLDKVTIAQVEFLFLAELLVGVKGVGKTEIRDDDVAVSVEEQVFELEITVDDALLMQVAHAGHKLGEETASGIILEVAVVQYVVEKFST